MSEGETTKKIQISAMVDKANYKEFKYIVSLEDKNVSEAVDEFMHNYVQKYKKK